MLKLYRAFHKAVFGYKSVHGQFMETLQHAIPRTASQQAEMQTYQQISFLRDNGNQSSFTPKDNQ